MKFAIVNSTRIEAKKGLVGSCPCCGTEVLPVLPVEKVDHWRHKSTKDCDPSKESETIWHRNWKNMFSVNFQEIVFSDTQTGERHIADIALGTHPNFKIIEFQHSPISDEEILSRESFYMQSMQMYWVVHLHDDGAFHRTNFSLSLGISEQVFFEDKKFLVSSWVSRGGSRFIEKWKATKANIIFDVGNPDVLFILIKEASLIDVKRQFSKKEFAVRAIRKTEFISSVGLTEGGSK